MKAILKSIKDEPCRIRDITKNEIDTFINTSHIQRYFSALDRFVIPSKKFEKNIELPSRFYVKEWEKQDPDNYRIWKAKIFDINQQSELDQKVFVKTVHLLDPVDYIKNYYSIQEHPFSPYSQDIVEFTISHLHSPNNQAYVDTIANFVLSRFRELDLTPHCIKFYGAITGIDSKYNYCISEEYESYKNKKWFWRGIQEYNASFNIIFDGEQLTEVNDNEELVELYKEIVTCPFDKEELENGSDTDSDIESELNELLAINEDEIKSIKSFTSMESYSFKSWNGSEKESNKSNEEDSDDFEEGDEEEEEEEEELEIYLQVNNLPVIKIFQEAQDGTMDELLDEEILDEQLKGTQGWESRWIAWIFQIVCNLIFLQASISFTHNDLHTNNIVWRKTDQKFIYYREKSGQLWRVPTFGKIFSIIDFGRSIFKINKNQWISSDFYPENDAAEQYNFGPFYDRSLPKVLPNYSFDLARLSVSLLDGLFEEYPEKKKGKSGIMSKEDDWIMYETKSPLFNLLWSWTVDDYNQTIYEDKEGESKFPGFDLYIHIAHNLHSAIPKEQLTKTQFSQFKWNKKPSKNDKLYNLGI